MSVKQRCQIYGGFVPGYLGNESIQILLEELVVRNLAPVKCRLNQSLLRMPTGTVRGDKHFSEDWTECPKSLRAYIEVFEFICIDNI